MRYKERLEQLVSVTPTKQVSTRVKSDQELLTFVSLHPGNTLSEKIYNVLYPNSSICELGNQKKFNSLTQGYRYCGRANVCQCARESVSRKVSSSSQLLTVEEKKEILEKRKRTTTETYGVSNVGQISKTRERHAKFYSDSNNVRSTVKKVRETKLTKYGSENYNNPEQIKRTFKDKDIDYWSSRYDSKDIKRLRNPIELKQMFETMSVYDIADSLNVHIQTVYRYLNKHKIKIPFKSIEEKEVVDFIKDLGITNIIENSRSVLASGKELDIYLPDYNIAIEYNGVYWHHDDIDHITRSYHYNKYKECKDLGIQLITIFSPYWKSKKSIVKKFLINKLKLTDTKVYARKCIIHPVTSKECKDFLDETHILGYTPASIRLGLYYNGELVSLMTFSKSRVAIGKEEEGYELVRYATSKCVTGGASRLLKHFMKTYSLGRVVSYSDNEWSDGNLYKILGFKLEKEVPPSYWYIKPREERMYHRFTFSKQKLVKKGFDKNLTEKQITKQIGLLKVWDCGKLKWVLE